MVDRQSAAGEMKTRLDIDQPVLWHHTRLLPCDRQTSKEPDAILGTETTEGPDDHRSFLTWTISWSSREGSSLTSTVIWDVAIAILEEFLPCATNG